MRSVIRVLLFAAAAAVVCVPALPAQTWFKVAAASTTLQVTIPIGTIYRYGNVKDNKWSPVTTAAKTFTVWNYVLWGGFPFSEPDYGSSTPEELQVKQTNSPQTITLIDYSSNRNNPTVSTITVPALPVVIAPPPPPPPTTTMTYSFSCTGTVTGTVTIAASGTTTLSASAIALNAPCSGVKQ